VPFALPSAVTSEAPSTTEEPNLTGSARSRRRSCSSPGCLGRSESSHTGLPRRCRSEQ
jgi:hypothetical protein